MLEPHRELVSLLRRKLELLLLLRAGGEDLLRGLTAPPRTDRDPPRDPTGCALRWLAEQDVLLRRLRLLDREVRERCGVLAAALGCPGETSLGGLEARLPEALRKELAGLRG
ncbi:MAG: hypothetical protein H5T97_09970, partial [Firmicutes bacterium]|nr:hypothetical protein [Bacillota bacterium]